MSRGSPATNSSLKFHSLCSSNLRDTAVASAMLLDPTAFENIGFSARDFSLHLHSREREVSCSARLMFSVV